jgi:hypothetical protein
MSANSALLTDNYTSALPAQRGAAKVERWIGMHCLGVFLTWFCTLCFAVAGCGSLEPSPESFKAAPDVSTVISIARQCQNLGNAMRPLDVDPEQLAKVMITSCPDWISATLQMLDQAAKAKGFTGARLSNAQVALAGGMYRIAVRNSKNGASQTSLISKARRNISDYFRGIGYSTSDTDLLLKLFEETYPADLHGGCAR